MAHNIDFTKTLLYVEGRVADAKRMLQKGYTIFQVQDITELSFEEIKKLQDEINNNTK